MARNLVFQLPQPCHFVALLFLTLPKGFRSPALLIVTYVSINGRGSISFGIATRKVGVVSWEMTWVSVCLDLRFASGFWIYGVLVLTGKTIQVIAFLTAIMKKSADKRDKNRRGRRAKELAFRGHDMKDGTWPKANAEWPTCLIITPPTLLDNWQRELKIVSS